MSWLPRISSGIWCACDNDGEVDGVAIRVTWRSWEIEVCFGRHNGRFR